jgi:hypothetical protein
MKHRELTGLTFGTSQSTVVPSRCATGDQARGPGGTRHALRLESRERDTWAEARRISSCSRGPAGVFPRRAQHVPRLSSRRLAR